MLPEELRTRRRLDMATRAPIDRERTCPLLLRTFMSAGKHRRQDEYAVRGKEPVDDEVQIHTWMDASLRELSDLIKARDAAAFHPSPRRDPPSMFGRRSVRRRVNARRSFRSQSSTR